MSSDDPLLDKGVHEQRMVSYAAVAFAAAALFDHCITLDGEIDLVWRRKKWRLAQVLFVINRYLCDVLLIYSAITLTFNVDASRIDVSFLVTISMKNVTDSSSLLLDYVHSRSYWPFTVIAWGSVIALWSMQGIVIFRLSSMYDHTWTIISILLIAFFTEISATTLLQALSYPSRYNKTGPQLVPVCSPPPSPWWSNFFWVFPVLFEVLMLGLSIYKGVQTRKETLVMRMRPLSDHPSIMYVLLRDSILFPFVGLAVCVANLIGSLYFSFFLTQFSITLANFATHIIGARLILNLREAYYRPFDDEYSIFHETPSAPIAFTPGIASIYNRNRNSSLSVNYDIGNEES